MCYFQMRHLPIPRSMQRFWTVGQICPIEHSDGGQGMFAHMRHYHNLLGSRDGKDGLLNIKYADPAKYIQAIWGQKNFWKSIGTARLSRCL